MIAIIKITVPTAGARATALALGAVLGPVPVMMSGIVTSIVL
jgi:hypothetical protein